MENNNFGSEINPPSLTNNKPGKNRWYLWILIGFLIIGAFRLGYSSGRDGLTFEPSNFKVTNLKDQEANVDYGLLWKTLDIVRQKYINTDQVNEQQILYGAIKGAVSAAGDEYTEFFDPEDLESFKTELKGSFEGIGAEVSKRDDNIIIVAPLDDAPAQKAGLLAQDIILQIDGESTIGLSVDAAVSKIRGPKGSKVVLTIFRDGRNQPFDVEIIRNTIAVKSVNVKYREQNGQQVAVIKLSRFGDDTVQLLNSAIAEAKSKNVAGVVVDLRNNPGGYLEGAVDVASNWVKKGGLVVTERRSDEDSLPYVSDGYNTLSNIKTVVLINGGSASAAEILAGALRDHNIAQLVGEKSYGKGSVQELIGIPGSNSAVKVTVAKWITPGGKNLDKEGINPDIEVKLTEDDIKNNRDPQLERALEAIFN